MTSIYRFHHLSGRSRQEVEGLVDRAGQVAEVVAGRASGPSWGKIPSWAIRTGPVLNTRSVLGTPSQNIFVWELSLTIYSSSTASTAKHSAITLAQSSKPSTCRSEYIPV